MTNFFPIFITAVISTTERFKNLIPEAPRSIQGFKSNTNRNNQISSDGLKLRKKVEEILFKHQSKTDDNDFKQENNKIPIVLHINDNTANKNDANFEETGDETDKEDGEREPFTVVRVSSSVSQVHTKLFVK